MPTTAYSSRMPALDGLRGVAALVVLLHHAALLFPIFTQLQERRPAHAGAIEDLLTFTPLHLLWAGDEAVLIFFVLSGFVVTLPVFRSPRFTWAAYFPSRMIRLYVPVVGAVGIALLMFAVAPWGAGSLGRGPAVNPTLAQVLGDVSLARGSASVLNNVLWSLHYEVLFSLLLPVYVLAADRARGHWGLLVGGAMALSTAARILDVQAIAFLAVFAIGVTMSQHLDDLGRLRDRIESSGRPAAIWWMMAAAAGCALVASWYPLPAVVSRIIGWPLLLIGAASLVYLAAFWPLLRKGLESTVPKRLGSLSFGLYLVHMPILSVTSALFSGASPWRAACIALPASFLGAAVFSRLIEKPSHRLAQHVARFVATSVAGATARRTSPAQPSIPLIGIDSLVQNAR